MNALRCTMMFGWAVALLWAGCAVSPEEASRRDAMEADIAAILSIQLDPSEYGTTKRCLSDLDFRTFRALDDKRILFVGRHDRLWLNTLKSRCFDLRYGDVLVVRSFSSMRMCEMDTFQVADWFDWPWYRRWPWHWGGDWGMGPRCTLGKFQPVTADQVAEIEAVLRAR